MVDLERFNAELRRLSGDTGHNIVPADSTGQIRGVYFEAALQAATVDAKRRVAEVIAKADDQIVGTLHDGVLAATAKMEQDASEYTTERVRKIAGPVTDAFSQQKFAHNLAYYQTFGDQALRELRREIVVQPPVKKRRRWFSDE